MRKLSPFTNKKNKAQAMVEFALVLPILLLIIYGMMETGRLLFIYASTVTAARQAVRYGSATGVNPDTGEFYYEDCNGITNAARGLEFIHRFDDVSITYDAGVDPADGDAILLDVDENPSTTDAPPTCQSGDYTSTVNGHRILVTVTSQWQPIVPIIPLKPFTITSSSERTILASVDIQVDAPIPDFVGTGGTPKLSITTPAEGTTYDSVGDIITYTFVIENIGDADLEGPFNVFDTLGVAASASCYADITLAPDQTHECTGTYIIKQEDLDRGYLTNTANSVPTGAATNDSSTIEALQNPRVSITKTACSPTTGNCPIYATTTSIQYRYTLTNTGNITLEDYTITDDKLGNICAGAVLAPGATVNYTNGCVKEHTVTETEIGVGSIVNEATGSATYTDRYGSLQTVTDSVTAEVITSPIYLRITSVLNKGAAPYRAETITYTFSVQNNGDAAVNLNSVTVTQFSGSGGTPLVPCSGSINPTQTLTCAPVTYIVTQADLDKLSDADAGMPITMTALATAGSYISTALHSTELYRYPDVSLTANTSFTASNGTKISPAIATADYSITDGTIIDYEYIVKNEGNVTLTVPSYFEVTDEAIQSGIECTLPPATGPEVPPTMKLAPNAAITCTASREISEEQYGDITNGSVIGTARSALLFGKTSYGSTLYEVEDQSLVVISLDPKITLTISAPPSVVGEGAFFEYTYTLLNSGNAALATFSFSGQRGTVPICQATSLAIGASTTCTGNYTTSPTDLVAGQVTNSATVTAAVTPSGSTSDTDTIIVYVTQPTYCNVNRGELIIPPSGDLGMNIVNNNSFSVEISSVTIYFNDTPAQAVTRIDLGGNQTWGGKADSPATVTLGGAKTIPAATSYMLAVTGWNKTYEPSGTERIVVNFASPSACAGQPLDSSVGITYPTADFEVTKGNGQSAVDIGSITYYTIRVDNLSGDTIAGVILSDPVAAGLQKTKVECSSNPGICNSSNKPTVNQLQSGTYPLQALTAGQHYEIIVTANVTQTSGSVTNVATLTMPLGTLDLDSVTNDLEAKDTDSVVKPNADIAITKDDGITGIDSGASTTYTIIVTNNGESTISNAKLRDLKVTGGLEKTDIKCAVIANNACKSAPTEIALESSAGALLPTLVKGDVYTLLVTADVIATSGSVTNVAEIILPATTEDPIPANNSWPDTNTITAPIADLAVSKSDGGRTSIGVGGTLDYTIRVDNLGDSTITGAILKDIPSGISIVSVACSSTPGECGLATTPTGPQLISGYPLPKLAKTDFYEIVVTANVTALSGTITNEATIEVPAGATDPVDTNDSSSDSADVTPSADLMVEKSNGVGVTTVTSGSTTTYTIKVTNNGPSPVTGATLTDTPTNISIASATIACTGTAGNKCNTAPLPTGANLTSGFALPTLGDDEIYEITVTANVTATSGTVSNAATIAVPSGTSDPSSGNNTATDGPDTVIKVSDLTITKSNLVASVNTGSSLSYDVVITNNGPSVAEGAVFKDPAVSGLNVTSVTCAASGTSTCPTGAALTVALMQGATGVVIPTIQSGASNKVTFTVTGTIPLIYPVALPATLTNAANVTIAGVVDSASHSDTVNSVCATTPLTIGTPALPVTDSTTPYSLSWTITNPLSSTVTLNRIQITWTGTGKTDKITLGSNSVTINSNAKPTNKTGLSWAINPGSNTLTVTNTKTFTVSKIEIFVNETGCNFTKP